jgi:two-component system response regulator RegA
MNEQSSLTMLVVDDDEVLNQTLVRAFKRRGIDATGVLTESAALDLCQTQMFDKAVVDLKLAASSGLQLIPQLLASIPSLQIVMLTGYSSIATAVEAIKLGAVNYLSKPADIEEILLAFNATPVEQTPITDLLPPSVDRLEWEHIQRVLHEHDGNISATARALGMHRRTLQRKLQKRPVKR